MSVRISAAERDALLEQIHARLTGIDDVWTAANAGDWELAERVAQGFSEELRLVVGDLGWGESGVETLELTTAPEVLRRVLARMQKQGDDRRRVEEEERADLRLREEGTAHLLAVCRRVLGELEEG
jgi:hypothetical protein